MQALKRIAQLLLPVTIGLPCLAVHVFGAEAPASGIDAQAPALAALAVAAPAQAPPSVASSSPAQSDGFGVALAIGSEELDRHRGGDALISNMTLNGSVADNIASKVATGSNSINEGSFANASGLPTVIQNSGANVLIQNATILNVRFGN
ncbi:hypothetical protein R75461_08437 [Paraburkholderia nemoris]|uniref:hypothetical protein n=1 Tax=Paraburkholderia nemoris TaxID=2793076 RepID=UPI001B194B25|nr:MULTISPECIES: hypothetical protein [Paraburkholderia]MBK3787164.1 hypothetical protein [Paraburkholderia aspalathi]CAE6868559.1 hypothetical protein R75461_08437 [Paraburkholderia nemoris]